MNRKLFACVAIVAVLVLSVLPDALVQAATGDPVLINEVFASHVGADDTEFVELYGTPGLSLAGLSLIVVESETFGQGSIDRRLDFRPYHHIGPNGFLLIGNCAGLPVNYSVTPDISIFTNYFENSSLTVALVETSSIGGASVTGGEVVRDSVGLSDGGAGDLFFFGAPVIGPDGTFFPAGARRVTDGVDTDAAADWAISDFNLGAANTPTGGGADGCAPIPLTIPEIQGIGQFSDYEGEAVTTSGIVTLYSWNDRNFWLQDPAGDGDPATSDGILVDDALFLTPRPEVGDLIQITAVVEELQFGSALPLTRLNNPGAVTILSSGNALPAPVSLDDLPDATQYEGVDFWEPLEGMRVELRQGRVSAPTNGFGEFGLVVGSDAQQGSGYQPQTDHLLLNSPSPNVVDYNPERIMVDDSAGDAPIVRPGERIAHLVGVVDYTFSMYKLQIDSVEVGSTLPLHTPLPVSKRTAQSHNLAVTTFNVENLFDLVHNPLKDDESSTPSAAELETKLSKLALAVELELALPDIIVLQEIENQEIVQELADRVNAAAGTSYVATSFETSDARGIEPGFLWDSGRVELMDAFQITESIVPGTEAAFGPSSASPGREPIVGQFNIHEGEGGRPLWVVGNHFKSKSGDDPIYGLSFVRFTEQQRKLQAQVVRDFVNMIFAEDADAWLIVAGDLNDFQFGEPGEGADHPVAILEGVGGGVPLTNLVNREKEEERFTYIFDGNAQVLDHMLVSPALLEDVVGADILHFNASYPNVLAVNPATPLHSSDHDALEGRFKLDRVPASGRDNGQSREPSTTPGGDTVVVDGLYLPLLSR